MMKAPLRPLTYLLTYLLHLSLLLSSSSDTSGKEEEKKIDRSAGYPPVSIRPRRAMHTVSFIVDLHRKSLRRRPTCGDAPSRPAVPRVGRERGEAGDKRRLLALQI